MIDDLNEIYQTTSLGQEFLYYFQVQKKDQNRFRIQHKLRMNRKQKIQNSKKYSNQFKPDYLNLLLQYRALIAPVQFTLKDIETYNCFAPIQLQNIETATIQQQKLKELVIDTLKLTFIYQPLRETLSAERQNHTKHISVKTILKILIKGQFYRFIENSQNHIKILINNRTTEANVKILVAALIIFSSRKLTQNDISITLLFYALEAALNKDEPRYLMPDAQKIIKVLKKIERIIKPLQFKIWLEAVKISKDFIGYIEPHQFLYLCSLSEKKFANGLRYIIFQPKISALFKNLNVNVRMTEFDQKLTQKDIVQERRIVSGLSFVEPRRKQYNMSKQILKQFRLKNPSKNQRPDTAYLKRYVKSFGNLNELKQPQAEEFKENTPLQLSQSCSIKKAQTSALKYRQKILRNFPQKKKVAKLKLFD